MGFYGVLSGTLATMSDATLVPFLLHSPLLFIPYSLFQEQQCGSS